MEKIELENKIKEFEKQIEELEKNLKWLKKLQEILFPNSGGK